MQRDERLRFTALGIMRIGVAFLYWAHGAQKFMGWFGGFGPDGGTAGITTRFGVAGVIEFFGGLLVLLGLFTRPVAFLISGEMAIAYFWMHLPRGGFWPWLNRGEIVACFSLVFLYLAAAGGGAFSLDGLRAKRRAGSPV